MFYFCTLYLQQVLGYSALKTGLSYLPFSLTLVAASTGAARFVDRFSPKPVLVTGLLISTVGFILMTQVSGHGDYRSHVLPAFLILALGLGLSFVPITISATNGVAPEDSGLASGLLNTTQQIGGSLGLAILSTVSTTRINDVLHAGTALPAALTHGFKGAFTAGALLCAAAAVLALVLLPRRKREVDNEEVEVVALSFARCPGAPYCGALARIAGWGRRIRRRPAAQE
jgi:MFS family permease